ncbi:MAG: hypothetical protein AAEJ65_04840, partial [Planctomycetota bacterium]
MTGRGTDGERIQRTRTQFRGSHRGTGEPDLGVALLLREFGTRSFRPARRTGKKCEEKKRAIYSHLNPWQRVQIARHPGRPRTTDYIHGFVSDFLELHGDGTYRDDPAIITGLGRIRGRKVMIVGHRKGKTNQEKVACFFGMPHPEG